MRPNRGNRAEILHGLHVLDGGMASELEYLGADIDGPLWSAHVLEDAPEKIIAVHRAYIEAGADVIETASYQVSRMGYAEVGLDPARADAALLRSVALARGAAAAFPDRRIVIAASLGPYGAALHNGAEYHGNYTCTFEDLVEFHADRIEILAKAKTQEAPDLLAFETLPSLAEAEAIGQALAPHPELAAWFSFTCRDQQARRPRRTASPVCKGRCRLPADRRHRRQLYASGAHLRSHCRTPRSIREAHRRLPQLRRRLGCAESLLDR